MGRNKKLPDRRKHVLVVDDDPAVRTFLADFLAQQGFEVQTARDGRTALTVLNVKHFDLILVDFQMPGITGLEMATEVRKKDPSIPIALITGVANVLDTEDVTQAGINRTFAKPFKLEELLTWIRSLPL